MPDPNKTFVLETDASDVGLGATLRQEGKPIYHISRVLKGAEKNYTVIEREFLAALWAMEKLKYFLLGKRFKLETDHKALEVMNEKKSFGNARIERWLDRISNFNFKIIYKEGSKQVSADTLSRNIEDHDNFEIEEKVLQIHEQNIHRKKIKQELQNQNIYLSQNKINQILKKCETCTKKDRDYKKSAQYFETFSPGEVFAVDIMDLMKKWKAVVGIDYVSRKMFGSCFKTKETENIVRLLEKVYDEFKFETLQTDNGREFVNSSVTKFTKKNNINHNTVTPHYHAANGRIERAIRTIRDGMRRTKGPLRIALATVINKYNDLVHRCIGMSPNSAIEPKNKDQVSQNVEKYKKEFSKGKWSEFNEGDKVILKNMNKKHKMDDEYNELGKILEKKDHASYLVSTNDGRTLHRHASHIRAWPGMLDHRTR